jgi:hypothetical protein
MAPVATAQVTIYLPNTAYHHINPNNDVQREFEDERQGRCVLFMRGSCGNNLVLLNKCFRLPRPHI